MQKVPEGDWFCSRCKPNQQPAPQKKKRQAFVYSEDEDENEQEETTNESEDSDQSTLESLFDDSPYVAICFQFISNLFVEFVLYKLWFKFDFRYDSNYSDKKVCSRCNKNSRNLFKCSKCDRHFDTKCLNLRAKPDKKWICNHCTDAKNKRRRIQGNFHTKMFIALMCS